MAATDAQGSRGHASLTLRRPHSGFSLQTRRCHIHSACLSRATPTRPPLPNFTNLIFHNHDVGITLVLNFTAKVGLKHTRRGEGLGGDGDGGRGGGWKDGGAVVMVTFLPILVNEVWPADT